MQPICGRLTSEPAFDRRHLLLGAMCGPLSTASAGADGGQVRAVYHLSEGLQQARRALLYLHNHLSADSQAQLVVVAHAAGVDALLDDAEDEDFFDRALAMDHLIRGGRVHFAACAITLASRKIDAARLLQGVTLVRSGVAEIARLQVVEGYAYLRP